MTNTVTLQRIATALEDIATSLRGEREPKIIVRIDGTVTDAKAIAKLIGEGFAHYRRNRGLSALPESYERPEHRACRRQG